MVERRATRADLLRRAVISLGMGERCEVLDDDVAVVCDGRPTPSTWSLREASRTSATTCRYADKLLNGSGVALVSEPPTDRTAMWSMVLHDHPHLIDDGVHQGIRRLTFVRSSRST